MSQASSSRPLAIVTGASSGIGYELAQCCAREGFDLLIASDEPEIEKSATLLRENGVDVQAVQADLATLEGVDQLCKALNGRHADVLVANAGHGLGKAFLDQDLDAARHVVDTNVSGTIALLHRIGREMRQRGQGRILVTGSIAGYMPGSFQAVYNASKAFLDSFSFALREELKDSGVSVTCLMPGATDTNFFVRADMLDTKMGAGEKDDPAQVARIGFDAMMQGKASVVTGMKNKLRVATATITPSTRLARMHRKEAAPGTDRSLERDGQKKLTGSMLLAVGGIAGGIALAAFLRSNAYQRMRA